MRYDLGSLNSSRTLNISAIEVEFLFHISHFPIFDGFFRLEITRTFKYLKVQILSFPLLRNNFFEHFFFLYVFIFLHQTGIIAIAVFIVSLATIYFLFLYGLQKKKTEEWGDMLLEFFQVQILYIKRNKNICLVVQRGSVKQLLACVPLRRQLISSVLDR